MLITRTAGWRRVALAASILWAARSHAAGLGPLTVHSALGQPLSASVMLVGEADSPDLACTKAKVETPDGTLLTAARITLKRGGQSATIELATPSGINEPAVSIRVALGCGPSIVRSYDVLLDPAPLLPSMQEITPPSTGKERSTAILPAPEAGQQQADVHPENRRHSGRRGSGRPGNPGKVARSVLRLGGNLDHDGRIGPRLVLSNSLALTRMSASVHMDAGPEPAGHPPEPDRRDVGAQASALQADLQALRTEIVRMQRQSQADKTALEAMYKERFSFNWIAGLAGVLLLCLVAIAWLIWRLHALQNKDQQLTWNKVLAELDAPTDIGSYDDTFAPGDSELQMLTAPAEPRKDGRLNAHAEPDTVDSSDAQEAPATRKLDKLEAEEISDAIQLAEFWMSFRQPARAIEALAPYKNLEQPKSPAPWAYLLDLYRSTGNREEYEALRQRVRQAFNLRVPAWDDEPENIRSRKLADFPDIVDKIHRLWPGDELLPYLDSLLIDRRDGTRTGFDPAVYRDIMKLIGIAEESRGANRCDSRTLERLHAILPQQRDTNMAAGLAPVAEDIARGQTGIVPASMDPADIVPSLPSSTGDNTDRPDGSDMGIKLNLAIAYQEIGEADGARLLLDEVIEHGTKDQSEKARRILAQLA